jgi:hypothetical protein
VHLKIQKISRVCTSGPPRYKGKKGKGRRRRIVESYLVTLFKKVRLVSAYGKNEMKRERGGEGRKRKKQSRRDGRVDKTRDVQVIC